jgi:8-oxo-dGTP diphosphatase
MLWGALSSDRIAALPLMITVVAALIERDGRILIGQRRKDDVFPLKWEFPGGKIHAGETLENALVRELHEELGVRATIGPERFRARHRYEEHGHEVELIFFSASLGGETPQNLAFEQIFWADLAALQQYDLLEADRELAALLAAGTLTLR